MTETQARAGATVTVRRLQDGDLEAADQIMRSAFGAFLGVPDPDAVFGDADYVATRYRAAPECAWAAELDGQLVGSNFATRWGSFGFFGPLTVRVDLWDRGIGGRLMEPVLELFAQWGLRQAGLFTFPHSAKHIGLYQKHGFWPRFLTAVMSKPVAGAPAAYSLYSELPSAARSAELRTIGELTNAVFPGLDLEREVRAVDSQALGDILLVRDHDGLVGVAICHRGARTEAGSGACFVKFGAVRPDVEAQHRFETLLDACEHFAAASALTRLVAGVNTGRLDAYRRMLSRGFRADLIGLAMLWRPDRPDYNAPEHYVIDDLR